MGGAAQPDAYAPWVDNTERLRVVLIGGSGFLGRGVRERLVQGGHDVVVVGRGRAASHDGWREMTWDTRSLGSWTKALDGADVVMHLAGKRVDCRPTRNNIDELIASRAGTVRIVGDAVRTLEEPPKAWVQLSSLAIFGDSGDEIIDEQTPLPADGPRQQVEVCLQWEQAFRDATVGLPRTVLVRPAIGIGGADDPATAQLARLARLGLAGSVAGGRQWVSWIGIDDFLNQLVRAVTDSTMRGLYHLTAPTPVQNEEFMAAYRSAVGRRFGLASPAFITKVGATLLGSDPALAITGRRCIPSRLITEGYHFRTTAIASAVESAVRAS